MIGERDKLAAAPGDEGALGNVACAGAAHHEMAENLVFVDQQLFAVVDEGGVDAALVLAGIGVHDAIGAGGHEVVQMFRQRLQHETVLDFAHTEQIRSRTADLTYDQTELPDLGPEQVLCPAFQIVLQPLGNPRLARRIALRRKQVFDIPERQDILGHDPHTSGWFFKPSGSFCHNNLKLS
ncbi:hypothetical protein D3C72_1175800 [compost metagenome]